MSKKQEDPKEESLTPEQEESLQEEQNLQEEAQTEEESQEELSPEEALQKQLEELQDENSKLKDQYLRKQADFENYRKRMLREKEDSVKYGNSSLLTDLVDVIDNFERAIQSAQESSDFQSFHDGIVMIEQQFSSMLANKYNLEKLEALGKPYDANQHEALMMEELEDIEEPQVTQVFQTGYKLHDRVLRPAKVKMAKPAVKAE